jgi:tRNA-Thr(GGU) m(6)t(6)A37 methyltransferase TsaA
MTTNPSRSDSGTWRAIGRVRSPRSDPALTDHWADVISTIELDRDRFGPESLAGLADFSHLEVVFVFHGLAEREDYRVRRHPRGRTGLPAVGVFADRGPRRPNLLGLTICQLVSVQETTVTVRGLDALDGSPVLDLKPVVQEFLPDGVRQPAWMHDLLKDYYT